MTTTALLAALVIANVIALTTVWRGLNSLRIEMRMISPAITTADAVRAVVSLSLSSSRRGQDRRLGL